jgi:hypothetical protein
MDEQVLCVFVSQAMHQQIKQMLRSAEPRIKINNQQS